MPLGAGGEHTTGEEGYVCPEKKHRISSATMALIGVFAAGLGMVYLLGLQNKPRKADASQTAKEQQVSNAIQDLLSKQGKADEIKGLLKDTDRLVQLFDSAQGTTRPTDDLPVNPFERTVVRSDGGATPVLVKSDDEEKWRKAAESFGTLRLQSVILGNQNMAMINNQLVSQGAKLGPFSVLAIEPQRVVLGLGERKFELKMDRGDGL
jgi:hypothetical protein